MPRAAGAVPRGPAGRDDPPWLATLALAAAMLGAYLWLAPPVSGDKDASEFALALATGGVIHPTGYPLYTLLGHSFVRLLHGLGASFPFAANAWAALGGGVAMALYHRLALRVLPAGGGLSRPERFALAALPVLMLGFNPVWMVEATVVEVHSWQIAWACGLALAFVGLVEGLEPGRPPRPRLAWRMGGWGFLCGLGGAHHTTAIFLAGGLTVALAVQLARARRLRAWVPAVWLAAGLVPLSSYAWIYFRALHPGAAQVWPTLEPTFASVLDHVAARAYRVYLGRWAPDGAQAAWLDWYIHPYLWAGLALFTFHALRARGAGARLVALGLLGSALTQSLLVFRYGVPDPDAYFLPGLVVALLAIATAGANLLPIVKRARFGVPAAAAAVFATLALLIIVPSVSMMRGRERALVEIDRYYHSLWQSIPYPRGIVLWPSDLYYRLKEYQVFGGEKPGLDVYDTAGLFNAHPRAQFIRRYGFDPLGAVDEAHRREPLHPNFVIGQQESEEETHAFAVVHEYLTQKLGLPVIAFDPPKPLRAWIPRPEPAGGSPPARATPARTR